MVFTQHPVNPNVSQFEHNGVVFDVPMWIQPEVFEHGVKHGDDLNPWSSLIGFDYIRSDEFSGYDANGQGWWRKLDIYRAQWLIPFNSIRELADMGDIGILTELNGERAISYEITDEGVRITAYVTSNLDNVTIYSMVMPRDTSAIEYHSYDEAVRDDDHLAEVIEAIKSGETSLSDKATDVATLYEEFIGPDGKRYFFLTNINDSYGW